MSKKLALIIGNNDYTTKGLKSCVNDAKDLANALRSVDYKISLHTNLKSEDMYDCIRDFIDSIQPLDFVIFFFSGHGVQWGDQNFLLPCDNDKISDAVDMIRFGINAQETLNQMLENKPSTIVFLLDCCREYWRPKQGKSSGAQSVGGLHQMKAPAGTVIVFACGAGETANDESSNGRNSIFTKSLLRHITTPAVDVEMVLRRVGNDVLRETNNKQQLYRVSCINSDNVYIVPPVPTPSPNRDITSAKSLAENKDARTDSNIQESLSQIRPIMKEMYELSEYTTPRYFFIIPAPHCDATLANSKQNLTQIHYKLYFLCECSHDPREMHAAAHEGYSIKRPKEFVTNYASYLRVTLKILEILLHVDGFVFPQFDYVSLSSSTSERYNNLKRQLSLVENLINKFDNRDVSASSSTGGSLRIEQLQELEEYIERVDENGSLGNLYRTITSDGHVRWTCEQHYDEISSMEKYITVLKSMNSKFDKKTKEAIVTGAKLSRDNIMMFCEALSHGFNIVKLVFENCSISDTDLDKLFDVVINHSSIRCLCIKTLTIEVSKVLRKLNYTCQYMITDLSTQRMKVSFSSLNQEGNTRLFTRLLLKNKICRQLSFEPNDILWNESDFRRCLDENSILRMLEIKHCNNADILNMIFGLKKSVARYVKLSYSLNERSVFLSFCEMLKRNQMLNEIDLMNEEGFQDEISIECLLNTLKNHRSVKYLKLHIRNIQPSSRTETQLIQSLRNDEFISHLCISKSVVSNELNESFIHAIQYHKTLAHLKFYNSEMAADNKAKLQSLYDMGSLKLLALYEEPRWLLLRDKINEGPARVIPNLPVNATWEQLGVTVAGGHGYGGKKNQLNGPFGLFVDDYDDQTIVIADLGNDRIMRWKRGDTQGQVVAGGNGQGIRLDQLSSPTDVLIDKETNSVIIADRGNGRVVRWSRRSGSTQGEILIENTKCYGLAMDEQRNLYVSDTEKHEVRRYEIDRGDKTGTVVAGGHGEGSGLNQLIYPTYLFVDRNQSLYVSDYNNHRVMKWDKGATQGVVIAGGQGRGSALTQLSCHNGIFVDTLDTLYVAEERNHRVTRWPQGSDKKATVVVGGNGVGSAANQFCHPVGLSLDKHGNLYVVDESNHRVQRFNIIK